MEASVVNFVEPGDSALVGIHGVFGQRLAEEMNRCGAQCTAVVEPFGTPLKPERLASAAEQCRPKVIAVVHAETSTGVLQPIEPIREVADKFDSLLLVDTVTSLGGHPVHVDEWGIDICYSGTQKCLSCPPGLSPFTASPRAIDAMSARTHKCQSWYLDLSLVQNYWGKNRAYHHTAPISMNYALNEALEIILEGGLESRWNRHLKNHKALVSGIEAMGLRMHVEEAYRLWSLNTVVIPDGIDDSSVRKELLSRYNLEIGGGLGELMGRVWRVGLMGESSRARNLLYFLNALGSILTDFGFSADRGAALAAASEVLDES
jgi:alanine-glyoxylate transaminase/serine-glyoxylate transaminase/serine-pyruvate transaminase